MVKSVLIYLGLSWLLLQIISVLTSTLALNPLLGSALLVLLLCCLPLVIYLAWYCDISFSGITRTASANEQDKPATAPGARQWAGLVLVMLLSGYVGIEYYGVLEQQQLAKQQEIAEAALDSNAVSTIAVLPFSDNSEGQDQGYLALGLAEEMTSLLGSAANFKVSASRSSQFLTEQGLTAQQVGQRLQVDTVLTGSVNATDNRLNVRVQLLDVKSGSTLWSNSYARELADVAKLEQDIGRSVVNQLQDSYAAAGSFENLAGTRSADAYVLYLKGREQYRKQTTEAMQQARQLFEQAVALDPEYANGYVGLADTLMLLAENDTGFGIIKTDIAANLAQQNIDKALARQPEMAKVYAVQGYIYFIKDEYANALTNFDQATKLNPSLAIAYMWKFLALNSLQRFDESLSALQQAQELDPLFLTNSYNLGVTLTKFGRFKEAEAIFQQIQIDHPESTFSYQGLADLYFSQGDLVGAIREAKLANQLSPDDHLLATKLISPLLHLGLTNTVKQVATDPKWTSVVDQFQSMLLIQDENFDVLFKQIDFSVAANPDDYWVQFEAGWYHSMFGDKQKALRMLTENSSLIDQLDMFGMPYCSPAIEIAWAQQELGNKEVALDLINHCRSLLNQQLNSSIAYFELHYLAARIYALEGNPERAIQAFAKAVDIGWREWWTRNDPLLASLTDDPEFQQLIQFIHDDLARQKVEALALFADDSLSNNNRTK